MEYLKSSYKRRLGLFAGVNFAIFFVVMLSPQHLVDISSWLESISAEKGLFAAFAPIGVLVLSGLMSAETKARLIYWRYQNPLPGSEAFSRFMEKDPRVSPASLKARWGELPTEPVEQNRLWYQIYKSVQDQAPVREAHRDWLFSRDLLSYAALFLLLFGPSALLNAADLRRTAGYTLLMTAQYFVLMLAARTYGRRFVCNALAAASNLPEKT